MSSVSPLLKARGFVDRLHPVDRQALWAMGHVRSYPTGAHLFHEGEQGTFAVLMVRGRVKVIGFGVDGAETIHGLCGPGHLVGELAVVDDVSMQRTAAAIALEAVSCRVLPAAELVTFFEEHPRATLELVRVLGARLHYASQPRFEQEALDVTSRVARLLVDLAETYGHPSDQGVRLDGQFSQSDLAGLVGASRESIVRALTALRRQELVVTSRRSLVLRDLDRLRSYGR